MFGFYQIKQTVFYAIEHVFFCFLLFFINFPLQTEKNGYYCFLIFNYIKCKLRKDVAANHYGILNVNEFLNINDISHSKNGG